MRRLVDYDDLGALCGDIETSRPRLTDVLLPGSGDFYVFDNELVLFLHYAGNGTNTFFEITEDPQTVRTCREAFEKAWDLATPLRDYRPE